MAVITVSRQLGSLGHDVARLVAEALGYRLVWREMINEAARRAGAPEVALATIDELDLLQLKPTPRARRAYTQAVEQVMQELMREGNVVIVGRAGQVVLRDAPGVLHVRIIAPVQLRAQRIAVQQEIPQSAAQAQVEASDRHRRDYVWRFFHAQWDDATLYDLIVNTAHLSPEAAADVICQATRGSTENVVAKHTASTAGAPLD
jgi:cytidylate kinase